MNTGDNTEKSFQGDGCALPKVSSSGATPPSGRADANGSIILEPVAGDSRGLICFDAAFIVLGVNPAGEEIAWKHFRCRPLVGKILPKALTNIATTIVANNVASPGSTSPMQFEFGESVVTVRTLADCSGTGHCLLFERHRRLTSARQLQPLALSPREAQVVFWILHDKTNWEIGKILEISTRTVDKHVEHVFQKLGISDRRELLPRARQVCGF